MTWSAENLRAVPCVYRLHRPSGAIVNRIRWDPKANLADGAYRDDTGMVCEPYFDVARELATREIIPLLSAEEIPDRFQRGRRKSTESAAGPEMPLFERQY